jgi:hypothetical protein
MRLVAAVMALFNLRLGYWVENPEPRIGRRVARRFPSLLSPGLRQGVLGRGLSEQEPWVQLSDGKHFDALGLYELIRREVEVIVVSDACAGAALENLGSVIQRVRSDFGAEIRLDATKLEDRGHTVGSVRYRSGREAMLIYVRAVLTPELPLDVRSYAQQHPMFPHEPTSDYSFSEAEFEAYRVLGETLALDAFEHSADRAETNTPRESMWRALRTTAAKDQASEQ